MQRNGMVDGTEGDSTHPEDASSGSCIAGLRKQIIANAIIMFPALIEEQSSSATPPARVFDIAIVALGGEDPAYQAMLTFKTDEGVCIAAEGLEAHTADESLQELLRVTANSLCKRNGLVESTE